MHHTTPMLFFGTSWLDKDDFPPIFLPLMDSIAQSF